MRGRGGPDRLEGGGGADRLFARDGKADDIGGSGRDIAYVDVGDDVFSVEKCRPRAYVKVDLRSTSRA
jgi:hypothetical protein